MIDIPTLRRSENHVTGGTGYQDSGLSYPLTARREYGTPPDRELGWRGRWVPRDEHGNWTGESAYFSAALMRDAYPGIVLVDELDNERHVSDLEIIRDD